MAAANLLRQLREQHGASLRAVAADLGIAPSHLSRLERGEKGGSPEVVQRAAAYYGVEVTEIAPWKPPDDVLKILREHPEALEELRRRYGS
jgi:transcriptional regulator with XRE-family HTH domain